MKDYSMCIDKKIIDNASLYKEVCDLLIADDFIDQIDCCETCLNIRLNLLTTMMKLYHSILNKGDYIMLRIKPNKLNADTDITHNAETIPLLDRELIQMIDKYDDPEEFKQAYLKRTDPNEPNPYAGIVFPYRKDAKRFEETHTTTQT